jgi:Predicted membrane-associated HD superfamily hydrolase
MPCTLMQKEAGIIAVADTIAIITQYKESNPQDTQAQADWITATKWRRKLYSDSPEEIDYQEMVAFVRTMSSRYSITGA